ncbi:response regulator [Aromatoleum petrolei]|uniref:Response regulator n=1 Tax=Aromatoleum petrolei TaxID=76116 RepID=A0ABX1MW56_9RHOO|nr:response regulator [Aromatoleum petrolei]NMF89307.1 response regulator [Aromatoleum petrolei]QTQ35137.1 Two component system response regulator, CheY-like [Aromatoleum petrolei]
MAGSSYVLLVEGDPGHEARVLAALRAGGFGNRVIVARDGIEALAFLSAEDGYPAPRPASQPAVVLLDPDLPRIDGLEVLRRIRAEVMTSLLPVVMFASDCTSEDIREAYRLGANSYVRKPRDEQEFERASTLIARYWLGLNEHPDDTTRF